jgi:hypothetical protein
MCRTSINRVCSISYTPSGERILGGRQGTVKQIFEWYQKKHPLELSLTQGGTFRSKRSSYQRSMYKLFYGKAKQKSRQPLKTPLQGVLCGFAYRTKGQSRVFYIFRGCLDFRTQLISSYKTESQYKEKPRFGLRFLSFAFNVPTYP